jgi:hypothetical protein
MKTQTAYDKMAKSMLILISALSFMACSKDKGSTPVAAGPAPIGGFTGVGPNCTGCAGFAQGPILFQGAAAAPEPQNAQVFELTQAQVVAEATGYQNAVAQGAQYGVRPLVNGTYPVAVNGNFRLKQPIACGPGVTYPAGDYAIQMAQMGQNSNGRVLVPVNLVAANGVVIQPAAVYMVIVDSNLDNVIDRGSLFAVGFCGAWLSMNTL